MMMMIRMRAFLLFQIVLVVTTTRTATAQETCPFPCANGSTCTTCEEAPFIGNVELCRDGQRCDCPAGWSGLRCHRPYESCYSTSNNDAHKCYNGGKCIDGMEDVYGNSQWFCDCDKAKDDAGNQYVGKYCENAAIKLCDDKAHEFCVNGRDCLETGDPNKNDSDFCDCGAGLQGPHCEFLKDSVPDCDLDCMNKGTCELGIKNYAQAVLGYNDFWNQHVEAMHCSCPTGYFGVRCEISAHKCGNHHCFNGATCVAGDDGSHNCDCTAASTHDASFAGRYCQYRSTTFCEKSAALEGQDFCVNGGTCKNGTPGCDCPVGFDGPLCEYSQTVDATGSEGCDLTCENEGVCRKGIKDMSILGNTPDDAPAHDNFQHCICPQGWFGVHCEKEIELCGNGQHVCLNGADCISINGKDWSCNCDPSHTDATRFAGAYCQHAASSFCTSNSAPGIGVDSMAFCVNSGTCLGTADGKGHPGCDCSDEFSGPHCEFSVSATSDSLRTTDDEQPGSSWEGLDIFLVVFFVVVAVLTVAIMYRVRQKRNDHAMDKAMALGDAALSSPVSTHSTVHSMLQDVGDDPVVLDFGPERDQEGTELSTVEII